jgi:PAS domain S-box-containing protein
METKRTKIIAIDDNQDNLISLKALIMEAFPDAITLTALNGKRGLELAAAEDPDVILLDIVMPGMDGFEVCQKLKTDKKLSDIPVVFVTALKDDKESRISALECGAEAFLAKPIDESELTAQIRAMVKIKAANIEKRDEKVRLAALVEEQTRELKKTHSATLNLLEDLKNENEARKITEEALRKSEEQHRAILQTAMDGFWLLDMQGRILEVNETLCRMTGYSAQELLVKPISDLEVAESADEIAAHFQKIIAQGEDRFESRFRRKDGSIFDVEVSGQYRPIENGRIVAFLRDITERKQAEEELQKKNAEIEQFIYTVSHDLRSPLVTVKTFMGYLEKDMAEDNREQAAQDVQFIHSAADKMKMLLDELLEMSRIGRILTPPVRVSLMEVVNEVMGDLAGVISERKVDICLPDTDLTLFGDRPRLCQIWQNLIENAIKFCRDDRIPRIELGVQQVSGETVFFVKDNGIGIDPQYHSKVFGIFEKINSKSPGAGLGLSMIQRIVEKCDGRVWVESGGTGKGSCFKFSLPGALHQD